MAGKIGYCEFRQEKGWNAMEKPDTIDYRFKLLYAIGTVLVVGGHLD